ncbi:MAG: hypothetical protein HFG49_08325 [Lachnospiraceae bacterium]|jgi:hypothetical protein|nr:hypothetical protein [Lachnospiraceae bacterium]
MGNGGSGSRVGFVSSYDAENGTASIYYPDRCNEVTAGLPVFMPFGLIQPLKKGDMVLVLHLSNGSEAGIVLGKYTAETEEQKSAIVVTEDQLIFQDQSGSISLGEIIAKCR